MTRIFLMSGEVSGDTHAVELMHSLGKLTPCEFSGLGGPRMNAIAPGVEDWLDEAAVLGIAEVLKKYGYFKAKMDHAIHTILVEKPDLVVLVDYPGFNLRLAKALRKEGYLGRIAYYISPQVWAWKRGRIKEMGRTLDLMLCIFPFEKALYEDSGLRTEFAGHPLIDELAPKRIEAPREENLVGLFPGSRSREIEALFPGMAAAAKLLLETRPELRFVSAAVNETLAHRLREIAADAGLPEIAVSTGNMHNLMQRVSCAAIASGTATLEAAYFGLPYVLVYKVAPVTAWIARRVMKVPYLGIVNNLAGRLVVKELLQENFTPDSLAEELGRMIDIPEVRAGLQRQLAEVVAQLGSGGAHETAARHLKQLLDEPVKRSDS